MKTLKKLLLYINTVRYLKPSQVFWKVIYRLRSFLFDKNLIPRWIFIGKPPREFYGPAPETKTDFVLNSTFNTGKLKMGEFTFLNKTKRFKNSVDWENDNRSKLWNYNLHYFEYLPILAREAAGGDESCLEVIDYYLTDWIKNNPPVEGVGWEPYPLSLRIVNWIKTAIVLNREPGDRFYESLYKQASFLNKSVEYHNLGNHIVKNGKALLFAGLFFGKEKWRDKGYKILDNQLDEQIFEDGGHFERSPMYHSLVLEDYLDVFNLVEIDEKWKEKIRRMNTFLVSVSHPDGGISLFNDSAFGTNSTPGELIDYYERITGEKFDFTPTVFSYSESGYYGISEDKSLLVVDCGKAGAGYQPAHAHCDLLSYELSEAGKRLVVDSGVYDYEDGDMRDYVRSTRAHNTFKRKEEQHEYWSVFRIARRSKPGKAGCRYKDGVFRFYGGYIPRKGSEKCRRSIIYFPGKFLALKDSLNSGAPSESYLHLSPDISNVNRESGRIKFRLEDLKVRVSLLSDGRLKTGFGWYCPEFGKRAKNTLVTFKNSEDRPSTVYSLNFTESEIILENGNIRFGGGVYEFFEL